MHGKSPKKSLENNYKKIPRFLKGALHHGIKYVQNNNLRSTRCTNSNWESCIDERQTTKGYTFRMRSNYYPRWVESNQ